MNEEYYQMNDNRNAHLERILSGFKEKATTKYLKGQAEHGGNLWLKKGMIDMAIDEAIDQVVYLLTLKEQIEKSGITLGELDE